MSEITKEILRVKVISAKMPTYWYSQYIGRYLYALEKGGKLMHCSEYGVSYREYFEPEDIVIDKRIKLEDKRVVKER